MLARYDLFVCPTTAVPALGAEHSPLDASFAIEGVRACPRLGWVLTYPFNLLGALPVLSVPSGRAASGVPTGVQLVARPHDDARVFRAAAALEAVRGAWFASAATRPAFDASPGVSARG